MRSAGFWNVIKLNSEAWLVKIVNLIVIFISWDFVIVMFFDLTRLVDRQRQGLVAPQKHCRLFSIDYMEEVWSILPYIYGTIYCTIYHCNRPTGKISRPALVRLGEILIIIICINILLLINCIHTYYMVTYILSIKLRILLNL